MNRKRKSKKQKPRPHKRKGKQNSKGVGAAYSKRNKVKNKLHNLRLQHREYIADVFGDKKTVTGINPGVSTSFPWLSTIAAAFEQYNWHHLKFDFVATVPTIQPGIIALCPDLDPDDIEEPYSKRDIYQFENSVSESVWAGVQLHMSQKDLQRRKNLFIRAGDVELERRLTDAMNLWVVTSGCETTDVVGELWVEYDITLKTPQVGSDLSLPQQTVYKTTDYAPGGAVAYSPYYSDGTDTNLVTQAKTRTANAYPDTVGGRKFYFPEPGYYTFESSVQGSGINVINPSDFSYEGCTLLQAEGYQNATFFEQILGVLVGEEASESAPAVIEWLNGPTATAIIDIATWAAETALPVMTNFFGHFFEAGIPIFLNEEGEYQVQEGWEAEILSSENLNGPNKERAVASCKLKRAKNRKYGSGEDVVTSFCYYNAEFAEKWQFRNLQKQRKRDKKRSVSWRKHER